MPPSGTAAPRTPIQARTRPAAVVLPPPGPPVRTMRQWPLRVAFFLMAERGLLKEHGLEQRPQQQGSSPAGELHQWLLSDEFIDDLIAQTGSDGVALTGKDGFLPELVRKVLERGLAVELTDHLGYDKGDPAGRGSGNSRNGSTAKTLATEVGPIGLNTPRDRAGRANSTQWPRSSAGPGSRQPLRKARAAFGAYRKKVYPRGASSRSTRARDAQSQARP